MNSPTSRHENSYAASRRLLAHALRREREGVRIRETPSRRNTDERLVQAIWNEQVLDAARLQTASGKALVVLAAGRWNHGAGPDFQGATVRLAGVELRGDIEIHVESSGWEQHRHLDDPAYANVVLHVFLHAADDRPYDTRADGRRVERVELRQFLEHDLETIRTLLNPEESTYAPTPGTGLCSSLVISMEEGVIAGLLDGAGRERFEAKVRRLADQRRGIDAAQVAWQALLTALGTRSAKTLYFLLSKRAPLGEVLDFLTDVEPARRPMAAFALLSGVAGLGPPPAAPAPDANPPVAPADSDSGIAGELADAGGSHDDPDSSSPTAEDPDWPRYREEWQGAWESLRPYFADRLIPPTRRWWSGVRPSNFPHRRIAAISHVLVRLTQKTSLDRALVELLRGVALLPPSGPRETREALRRMMSPFVVHEPAEYWSRRCVPGGRPRTRPEALLGEPTARSAIFNVLLPFGTMLARESADTALERGIATLAAQFPPLPENQVTEFMTARLFGSDPRAERLLTTELRRQALYHLFTDCCANNDRSCEDCLLLRDDPGQ